jgi:glycosyltransferase involved in cell wall biosynthesis
MKIIHVISYIRNESAGTTYATVELCEALQRNGCDITLYTLNPIIKREYNFKIKSYDTSWYSYPALGNSNKMYYDLLDDAKDADIIHSHMLWMAPSYYAGIVADKLKKPYVCSPHGAMTKWAWNRSKWKKNIVMFLGQKRALKKVDCFHVTAELEAEELKELNYDAEITNITLGIDIKEISFSKDKKLKRLVYLSRIHPVKGIDILLKAWNRVQDDFNEWELIIIGGADINTSIDYPREMKELSESLKNQRVKFLGKLFGKEKDEYLASADILVLPTHSENFGLAIAEALSMSVPVICTKGAPWKGLIEKKAGWWIDIGIEPLVETLKVALNTDKQILDKMGQNGEEWMKKDFSWDSVAKKMIKTYKRLANQNNKENSIEF